jgi:uncharacterized membrane protein
MIGMMHYRYLLQGGTYARLSGTGYGETGRDVCRDAQDMRLATLYYATLCIVMLCYIIPCNVMLSHPPDVYAARYRYTIARNIENN